MIGPGGARQLVGLAALAPAAPGRSGLGHGLAAGRTHALVGVFGAGPLGDVSVTVTLERFALLALAVGFVAAAVLWYRSFRRLERAVARLRREADLSRVSEDSVALAEATRNKDFHTFLLYCLLALATLGTVLLGTQYLAVPFVLAIVPVFLTLRYGRRFVDAGRLAEERSLLERRAEEVLAQEELAPMRWAARLAPGDLPEMDGFQVGQVYQPGSGAMAGDFYDLVPTGPGRLAAVIGDVTGHGIEPSITAFQVKYLLRVFLRQYRDPAQALEELNASISAQGRPEELVSLCAVVFDTGAKTLRFTSAGHPPAWLWHGGSVQPLRSTGPLLALDPKASYFSRELSLETGDVLLLYTDGLAEARAGEALFGEERVAGYLRRDPNQDVATLCKGLLAAAQDFAAEPLVDDVAILAVRRV